MRWLGHRHWQRWTRSARYHLACIRIPRHDGCDECSPFGGGLTTAVWSQRTHGAHRNSCFADSSNLLEPSRALHRNGTFYDTRPNGRDKRDRIAFTEHAITQADLGDHADLAPEPSIARFSFSRLKKRFTCVP